MQNLAEYFADVPYLYESKMKVLRYLDGEKCFTIIKKYPNGSEYFDKIFLIASGASDIKDKRPKKLSPKIGIDNPHIYLIPGI